ncbi:hypothetical protein [Streptomyces sp. NPDC050164]|uniref:hypothetical protein n=1 Tax=Streptomyces sp. NPDC050164 TaxID=3365605 RepID=UPI0037B243DC
MVGFLDRLRALGVDERIVQAERDGWIPLAARSPERVAQWVARKQERIADPEFAEFYVALSAALECGDDPQLVEPADRVAAYVTKLADERGEEYVGDPAGIEPVLAELMDRLVFDTVPSARRLIELLKQRGWAGWTTLRRVDPAPAAPAPTAPRPPRPGTRPSSSGGPICPP